MAFSPHPHKRPRFSRSVGGWRSAVKCVTADYEVADERILRLIHRCADRSREKAEFAGEIIAGTDETSSRKSRNRIAMVVGAERWRSLHSCDGRDKEELCPYRCCRLRSRVNWMSGFLPARGDGQRPKKILRSLFNADADIIPEPENGILRVRVLGLPNNAADATIARLFEGLNETETIYPGTKPGLVYELPDGGKTRISGTGKCDKTV